VSRQVEKEQMVMMELKHKFEKWRLVSKVETLQLQMAQAFKNIELIESDIMHTKRKSSKKRSTSPLPP
jgi:hypothetical protein